MVSNAGRSEIELVRDSRARSAISSLSVFTPTLGCTTTSIDMSATSEIGVNALPGSNGIVAIEKLIDALDAGRGHQQRVAVRLRLRDDVGADIAARARTILDDDRLAERLGSSSPTARASTSTSPPAGNGAIMRIGRLG